MNNLGKTLMFDRRRLDGRRRSCATGFRGRLRRGFTLIEASMTSVIIGVGFMATLQLLAAGTATNIEGADYTTGVNLAKDVREMMIKVPFAQVGSYKNKVYSPPVDSRGQAVNSFAGWSQTLTVQPVDPNRLTLDITTTTPQAYRITVVVKHSGIAICDANWLALNGTPVSGP